MQAILDYAAERGVAVAVADPGMCAIDRPLWLLFDGEGRWEYAVPDAPSVVQATNDALELLRTLSIELGEQHGVYTAQQNIMERAMLH